jgi:hypothetical protein
MIKNCIWIGLTLSLVGFMSATVRADEWDGKMVLTFTQPVEIPGHVLPAGTYTFKLADSASDRHIVQIFNADESQIIATVLAIPHYRATPTDQRIVTFTESPAGSPETIRAWFYPGRALGQEFVYPKPRATQLAKAAKAPVPAIAGEAADPDLRTVPVVAVTPDATEIPVAMAIETNRVDQRAISRSPGVNQRAQNARQLPPTAGLLPMVVLLGLGSIGVAFGLMALGKPATASSRV